jgi:hypothetical protein
LALSPYDVNEFVDNSEQMIRALEAFIEKEEAGNKLDAAVQAWLRRNLAADLSVIALKGGWCQAFVICLLVERLKQEGNVKIPKPDTRLYVVRNGQIVERQVHRGTNDTVRKASDFLGAV